MCVDIEKASPLWNPLLSFVVMVVMVVIAVVAVVCYLRLTVQLARTECCFVAPAVTTVQFCLVLEYPSCLKRQCETVKP